MIPDSVVSAFERGRVAYNKARLAAWGKRPHPPLDGPDAIRAGLQDALDAMEASDAMLIAGARALRDTVSQPNQIERARAVWNAMRAEGWKVEEPR